MYHDHSEDGWRVSVKRPEALTEREQRAWRDALNASPEPSPFLSPDFSRLAAAFRRRARVAVVRKAGVPVGFAPFEFCAPRVARPLAPRLNEVQGLVLAPLSGDDRLALADVARAAKVRLWGFSAASAGTADMCAAMDETEPDYFVDLHNGFDAFYEEKKRTRKKLVQTAERLSRKLEREVGPLRFQLRDPDPAALDALIGWKTEQLARAGFLNVFRADWSRDLVERAAQSAPDHGFTALISTLRVAERLAAVNVNLRAGPIMQGWFMAYDPEFKAYSPGLVTLFRVAEAAASEGVTVWRLGTGVSDYKERLATRIVRVGRGAVTSGAATTAIVAMVRGLEKAAEETPFRRVAQLPRRAWRKFEERSVYGG